MKMKTILMVAASLLAITISATAQNNAEQVTFSGGSVMTLTNNTKATSTPFGFWLWCSAQAPSGSNGGYAAHFACAGSMYFYDLGHTSSIVGDVSESPSGIYNMTVLQGTLPELLNGTLNPAYLCTLKNTVPDAQGPINSPVVVGCTFFSPAMGGNTSGTSTGSATVANAGVNVSGPK